MKSDTQENQIIRKLPPLNVDQKKLDEKLQKNLVIYLIFLGIFAGIIAIVSFFIVFPASVLDDYSLHRPYEIPSLILFTMALTFFYKKRLYLKKDVIYKGILIYLLLNIFSQIIMSYSTQSFDTAHNLAQVLKDVGYFVNIIALAISGIRYAINLKERNELIQNQYEKIKESEKIKDEFINIAAHELRTPIQPILALSIFLADKKREIEEYKDYIEIIIKEFKKISETL
jgi:signal transduction histidine kinase